MIERGEHFCFALKSGEASRFTAHRGGQPLDRHRSLLIAVGRAIDSPIPPAPLAETIS
jgi:hypothetical protein